MRHGRRSVAGVRLGSSAGGDRSGDPAVHAWGDPAIVARCGVAPPGPTTEDCLSVNGVDWVATPLSDGTRFVTYGRNPAIEVLIPKSDVPGGSLLPVFAAAAQALPETGRHCS